MRWKTMIDKKQLEEVYKQNLENDIINAISEIKGIDLRKAFDIYYSSKLAEQISNDSYGIENMDKNGMSDFYNCLCSCMMSSACSYCSPHMNLCFESERKVN